MNSRVLFLICAGVLTFLALTLAIATPASVPAAAGGTDGTPSFLPIILKPVNTPTPTVTNTATNTPTASPTSTAVLPTATSTAVPPTSTATTAPPTATATQPAPGGCSICSYDAYNCGDFNTQAQAQACHDYCWDQVGYDVHNLDADDDGEACESLPIIDWVTGP